MTLFVKYIIYCDIGYSVSIFLYGMFVNLIPGHTYYEHLVFTKNRVSQSSTWAMWTIGMVALLQESFP
jgi:hypothetical protein